MESDELQPLYEIRVPPHGSQAHKTESKPRKRPFWRSWTLAGGWDWLLRLLLTLWLAAMLAGMTVTAVYSVRSAHFLENGFAAYGTAVTQLLALKEPAVFEFFNAQATGAAATRRETMLQQFDRALHPTGQLADQAAPAVDWAFSDQEKLVLQTVSDRLVGVYRTLQNVQTVGETAVEISSRLPVVELEKVAGIILHVSDMMEAAATETPKIVETTDQALQHVPTALSAVDRVGAMAEQLQRMLRSLNDGDSELSIGLKRNE